MDSKQDGIRGLIKSKTTCPLASKYNDSYVSYKELLRTAVQIRPPPPKEYVPRGKNWKKSQNVLDKEKEAQKRLEYQLKKEARFMDSIHKYEKYQASIHGHTTGKEINHLDEEETISTYVERHYFYVICIFVTFVLIGSSILALII